MKWNNKISILEAIEHMKKGHYARVGHWSKDDALTIRDDDFCDLSGVRKKLTPEAIQAEWVLQEDELPRCPACGNACLAFESLDERDRGYFRVACVKKGCAYANITMPAREAAIELHTATCEKIKELRAEREKGE